MHRNLFNSNIFRTNEETYKKRNIISHDTTSGRLQWIQTKPKSTTVIESPRKCSRGLVKQTGKREKGFSHWHTIQFLSTLRVAECFFFPFVRKITFLSIEFNVAKLSLLLQRSNYVTCHKFHPSNDRTTTSSDHLKTTRSLS